MTENQFRRALHNRSPRTIAPPFRGNTSGSWLREAATNLRHRHQAEALLHSLLPADVVQHTSVSALCEGVLELTATNGVAYETLRRQTATLERQLPRRVPGVQRVRVVWQEELERQQ